MSESNSFRPPMDGDGQTALPPVGLSSDPLEILSGQEIESAAEIRYAPQAWLNAFKEIPDEIGPSMVFAIGQQIGRFGFIELGGSRAKLVCANTSPCEADQRLITDMAQRSASSTRAAKVVHDPTQPCRQKGGASCTYLVFW